MQFMLFLCSVAALTSAALAHSETGVYGSDLPESLIWLLSFFILIGVILVVGSYFVYPDPVTESREGVTYCRIHPSDIRRIEDLLRRHHQECV